MRAYVLTLVEGFSFAVGSSAVRRKNCHWKFLLRSPERRPAILKRRRKSFHTPRATPLSFAISNVHSGFVSLRFPFRLVFPFRILVPFNPATFKMNGIARTIGWVEAGTSIECQRGSRGTRKYEGSWRWSHRRDVDAIVEKLRESCKEARFKKSKRNVEFWQSFPYNASARTDPWIICKNATITCRKKEWVRERETERKGDRESERERERKRERETGPRFEKTPSKKGLFRDLSFGITIGFVFTCFLHFPSSWKKRAHLIRAISIFIWQRSTFYLPVIELTASFRRIRARANRERAREKERLKITRDEFKKERKRKMLESRKKEWGKRGRWWTERKSLSLASSFDMR